MNANDKSAVYTMPLRQLLKLLETTADDAARPRRRPRRRGDPRPQAAETPQIVYFKSGRR